MKQNAVFISLLILLLNITPAWAEEDEDHHIRHRELSDERVLGFVKENLPQVYQEAIELEKNNPEEYHEHLEEYREQVAHYLDLKHDDPEFADRMLRAHQLEHQSWQLAEAHNRTGGPEERAKIKAKLEKMLSEVFDIRLSERSRDLKHLKREIAELQSLVDQRKRMKGQIVERRLNELLMDSNDNLEWW